MGNWFARGAWGLLTLVLAGLVGLMVWEPFAAGEVTETGTGNSPSADKTYKAEIIRSEFGVPHIYGDTDADVAYGVAIAHAEDDFFTLQDVIAMTRGRYGAIAGEDGAQIDYAYYLLDARGTAERHYGELPANTRALFEAYASGLNHYAAAHESELKLDGLFPVNGEDVATGFALRQPFFFGLGNIIGPLVAGEELAPEFGPAIPGTKPAPSAEPIMKDDKPVTTAHAPAKLLAKPMPLALEEEGAMSGSNAWAIAPAKSGDGVTRLVSNSHQPWRGGVAWYELVVESKEGWHFAGANFPGSPFPFLGHNENLGWTNTVNRPDMTDIYKLEMDESGKRYKIDGEWRDLVSKDIILPVKLGPLVLPVMRTVYRSEHGPVIKNDKGYFAIRYGGMDNIGQLDAYYRLNKAKNFDEWQGIIARMDIPSTNFIYGDKEGNIAYVYNAAIPDRPAGPDWRNILPGNDSKLIWQGTVDYGAIPKVINPRSGWVYNSNNQPFSATGAADNIDPASVPPEMGVELKMTNRARRAVQLAEQFRIIDRQVLERIKYDTGYVKADYVARMLDGVAAIDPEGDKDLQRGQALLADWDFTSDGVGDADSLALLMIRPWMSAEYQNKPEPDPKEALKEAAVHLQTHFGRIDPPMAELLRLRQGFGLNRGDSKYAVDLPLDGGSDTLRASTLWDVDDDGRLSVRHGDSFLMFVEWEPGKRVRSQSIQPFGAATTRPDNPHYSDQAALFIRHELKPVHFWRVDALKNATRRKTVTNR